jgi:hypothetical protein
MRFVIIMWSDLIIVQFKLKKLTPVDSFTKVTKKLLIKMVELYNTLPPLIGAEGTDSCGMCVEATDKPMVFLVA